MNATERIIDRIVWIITVFLIASFQLFDSFTWGKLSFLICSVAILVLSSIETRGKIKVRFGAFLVLYCCFTFYVAFSSIWSVDSIDSVTMARTLIRTIVCFLPIYWHYSQNAKGEQLISAFVFSSYVVAIYTIAFYGVDAILLASEGARLGNGYANINSIAILLSIGLFCDLYLTLFKQRKITSLLSILSLFVIVSSQSRKAIVFLIICFFGLLYYRLVGNERGRGAKCVLVILLFACIIYVFIAILPDMPFVSGAVKRMSEMLNIFNGAGKVDHSTIVRKQMISVGWNTWKQYPLFGIGIAGTHVITAQSLSENTYLHNNYVELLSGGGIVGFGLYYEIYVVLLKRIKRIKQRDFAQYVFCLLFTVLLLILDWGRVSYYSKTTIFGIMMLFILSCNKDEETKINVKNN